MLEKIKNWLKQPAIIIVKQLAFTVLSVISALLSVNLYASLASEGLEKVFIGALVMALEGVKVYTLARAMGCFVKVQLAETARWWQKIFSYINRKNIKALVLITLYIGLSISSIIGSYGYALTTVNKTERLAVEAAATTVTYKQSDSYAALIKVSNDNIKLYQSQIEKLAAGSPTSASKFAALIEAESAKITENTAKMNEALVTEKLEAENTRSAAKAQAENVNLMFTLLAENFSWLKPGGLTENDAKFFLLILISILLELGILSTSPKLEEQLVKDKKLRKARKIRVSVSNKENNIRVSNSKKDNIEPWPEIIREIKPLLNKLTQDSETIAAEKSLEEILDKQNEVTEVKSFADVHIPKVVVDAITSEKPIEKKVEEPVKEAPVQHIREIKPKAEVVSNQRKIKEVTLRTDLYVAFVNALFNNKPHLYLKAASLAGEEINIDNAMASAFFYNLIANKLIEKKEDGHYYAKFTKQYIANLIQNKAKASK